MKNLIYTAIFSLVALTSYGQQETLFNKIDHIGGFGGPMIEVSRINGETVADVGGGGALILDNFFFGGYGLGTDAPNITISGEVFDIDFDHGGLWFGYVVPTYKLVHFYSSFKLGWGDATLRDGDGDKRFSDNVLVLSPEIGVELNVTSWFRVALTGGYRFVDGISEFPEFIPLTDGSFSGGFGNLTFRFGGFGGWGDYSDSKKKDFDSDFDF